MFKTKLVKVGKTDLKIRNDRNKLYVSFAPCRCQKSPKFQLVKSSITNQSNNNKLFDSCQNCHLL